VDVFCGRSIKVRVEVDGVVRSSDVTCGSAINPVTKQTIAFSSPPSLGSLPMVCVRSLPPSGTPTPVWTGDDSEDLHCRPIVVIKP
jgi:hypothetical protein